MAPPTYPFSKASFASSAIILQSKQGKRTTKPMVHKWYQNFAAKPQTVRVKKLGCVTLVGLG
jgi:hypothetical protein